MPRHIFLLEIKNPVGLSLEFEIWRLKVITDLISWLGVIQQLRGPKSNQF